jgi:hypothetical protein
MCRPVKFSAFGLALALPGVRVSDDHEIHQESGGASPEDDLSGGVSGVVEKNVLEHDERYLWD